MSSGVTTIGGDPIPQAADAAFVHTDMALYANAIDHKIIHWAQDSAERDVFYAAAAAPLFVMSPSALWCKISGSGGSSVWVTVWSDSGAVSSGVTPGTDFDTFLGNVRKIDEKFVIFSFSLTRRNSVIQLTAYNATSPGNIVGDPIMCTFPVGFRPDTNTVVGTWRSGTTDGAWRINGSDGTLRLFSGNPNGTIEIDEPVDVAGCFMAA